MQTHSQYSYFKVSEAWAILSDIEQSIKQKVEIVGTPLKDWDVEIYRGVLTGYNDAFIISSETRKEILDNCKSLDERQRTEEIIRPNPLSTFLPYQWLQSAHTKPSAET